MGSDGNQSALFAKCKWRNEKIDVGVLERQLERSQLFHYTKLHLYLFSKSGFTSECQNKAKLLGNVTLISFEEIVKYL